MTRCVGGGGEWVGGCGGVGLGAAQEGKETHWPPFSCCLPRCGIQLTPPTPTGCEAGGSSRTDWQRLQEPGEGCQVHDSTSMQQHPEGNTTQANKPAGHVRTASSRLTRPARDAGGTKFLDTSCIGDVQSLQVYFSVQSPTCCTVSLATTRV